MIMGFSDENFCNNAPWRDRDRKVMVRVTQTLVCDFEMDVPEFMEDEEVKRLASQVRLTPFNAMNILGDTDWGLDNEKVEMI